MLTSHTVINTEWTTCNTLVRYHCASSFLRHHERKQSLPQASLPNQKIAVKFTGTTVAVLASISSHAQAQGSAAVINMCDIPLYLWSVDDLQSQSVTLPNASTGYVESFRSKQDGSGISIKLGVDPVLGPNITQFEYTLNVKEQLVWYDLSFVNGNPLPNQPILLQSSVSSCTSVGCIDNATCSSAVYYKPYDNAAVAACDQNANLFLFVCPPASSVQAAGQGQWTAGDSTNEAATDQTDGASGGIPTVAPSTINMTQLLGQLHLEVESWLTFQNPASKVKRNEPVRHGARPLIPTA